MKKREFCEQKYIKKKKEKRLIIGLNIMFPAWIWHCISLEKDASYVLLTQNNRQPQRIACKCYFILI